MLLAVPFLYGSDPLTTGTPTASKQTVRLQALRILGPDLSPLEGATIIVLGQIVGTTDESGVFELPGQITLPAVISIQHHDYVPQTITLPLQGPRAIHTVRLGRYRTIEETVAVTAVPAVQQLVNISRAQTNLDILDIQESMPASITDLVQQTAAGSFIGSGGFSITPSIRGLARRRVLILLDGARVTSDRRAGASAAFIPPHLVRSFELIRSSGSVHLGSDAMGGILSMRTFDPEASPETRTEATLRYGTNGSVSDMTIRHAGAGRDGTLWDIGLWNTEAGDYSTPRETIANSGYMTRTLVTGIRHRMGDQSWYVRLLASMGRNIGKPDRANDPDSHTVNPYRYDHFLTAGWERENLPNQGKLTILFNLNPFRYQLERIRNAAGTRQVSDTTGFNNTVRIQYAFSISNRLRIRTGFDTYQRNNIRIQNIQESAADTDISLPLNGADRLDSGWFVSMLADPSPKISINAGLRFGRNTISPGSNTTQSSRKDTNLVGELGLVYRPLAGTALFFNAARSYRNPSLSETYYTGITGRRWVIGNPELTPETGQHLDAGFRISKDNWGLSGYLFAYQITDMIERFRLPDDTYTYDNIREGKIHGTEVFAYFRPMVQLELTGSWTRYRGRSEADTPLNDVPAHRLELAAQFFSGRWTGGLTWLHTAAKSDPGPAESNTDAFQTWQLRLSFFLSSNVQMYLKADNLADRFYYPTADPDIPAAPGRSVMLGMRFVR